MRKVWRSVWLGRVLEKARIEAIAGKDLLVDELRQ